ncbi:MAG: type II toxin-antitoxin system PemK/MazF family toxin [Salinibacter sp.]|uniref:type II toxin-antitoxin system PemK/MazF family toxin n=1 Tax=Salinibacter sp. TaxID=2065818 RepID=UPI0035D4C16A
MSSPRDKESDDEKPPPKRGEIWRVGFDPTVGSEIKKTRPAVVISSDAVGTLPVRLVAPFTGWQEHFEGNLWHIQVSPTEQNGLEKESAADALQVRSVDTSRFTEKLGRMHPSRLEEVVTAVALVIEYR